MTITKDALSDVAIDGRGPTVGERDGVEVAEGAPDAPVSAGLGRGAKLGVEAPTEGETSDDGEGGAVEFAPEVPIACTAA